MPDETTRGVQSDPLGKMNETGQPQQQCDALLRFSEDEWRRRLTSSLWNIQPQPEPQRFEHELANARAKWEADIALAALEQALGVPGAHPVVEGLRSSRADAMTPAELGNGRVDAIILAIHELHKRISEMSEQMGVKNVLAHLLSELETRLGLPAGSEAVDSSEVTKRGDEVIEQLLILQDAAEASDELKSFCKSLSAALGYEELLEQNEIIWWVKKLKAENFTGEGEEVVS